MIGARAPTGDALAWLGRRVDAAPGQHELRRLAGSTSSSVYLVKRKGNAEERFVLRVLDNRDWLGDEPDLAAHEAAALQQAEAAGLKAPRLIAYSEEDVGFGAPVVLMSFVEGCVTLRPRSVKQWLHALALELASIHRHSAAGMSWRYRSWLSSKPMSPPSWSATPRNWEEAAELVACDPPQGEERFIHRDYHPVNVLWRGASISGVVDWINACRGPRGVDVAHCRTNLVMMKGALVADQFLSAYEDYAEGFAHDLMWDVYSLLDMCLPKPTFYRPWRDFGLPVVSADVLARRMDEYLESLLSRLR